MFKTSSIIFAIILLVSCSKQENAATYIEGVGTSATVNGQAQNNASSLLLPAGTSPAPSITSAAQSQVPASPGNTGTNPAHGKPGHRCDIPVGAPLSTTPAAVNSPQSTAVVSPPTASVIPSQGKTAPGMNPPHGETGHRCDIPVGAPLNSKPATKNSTANKPVAAPAVAPAVATETALAMNPPHGEPGHRCDIAVGAPLK